MSYTTILLKRAQKEFLESWIWYEDKQAGLGERFKTELYQRIHAIEQHPERYPLRTPLYRETRVNVFPYLIIYRIDKAKKLVIVTSIFHASRNPKGKYRK